MAGAKTVPSVESLIKKIAEACSKLDLLVLEQLFSEMELLDVFKAASEKERHLLFPLLWEIKNLWQCFWSNLGPQGDDLDLFDGSYDEDLNQMFSRLGTAARTSLLSGNQREPLIEHRAFQDAVLSYYLLLERIKK